jgi:CheY-like chemotaxis protein
MDATLTRPRVLVLRGSADAAVGDGFGRPTFPPDPDAPSGPAPADLLDQGIETAVAGDLGEALRMLRRGRFDAVLAAPELLTGPERNSLAGRLLLMLDRVGEGVCLLTESGEFLWTNRRVREWGPGVADRVRECARETARLGAALSAGAAASPAQSTTAESGATPDIGPAAGASALTAAVGVGVGVPTAPTAGPVAPPASASASASASQATAAPAASATPGEHRFDIADDAGRHFEVLCNPIHDPVEGGTRVLAIVHDATAGRRLQQKIDAIDRAGRELVRLDRESVAKLDMPQRLDMLEEKIVRYAHQLLDFDHFNIRLLDKKTNRLQSVITTGLPGKAEIELSALPEGNGISGWVASTGKSYICTDILTDPLYLPGLDQARSSLTVPLRLEDEVVGVFNIESREPARFRKEDCQFAEIFGRYVAIALNMLELLVVERHRTTGRLAEDVAQEISGPLNDIIADTTALLGDDPDPALRKRLLDIVGNVERIRGSLKKVGESTGGLLGVVGEAPPAADPVLGGKRVLVADDEAAIRETIADVLVTHGAAVDQAVDGADACGKVATAAYDLVLSDIRMPQKNGYEVYSAAKERNPATPVVLMTGFGYDPNHSIVKARREGLAGVLFKPFKVNALLETCRNALTAPAK